ncbi:uncharacterized protein LOC131292777, partial [Anopheles ziemanni]|uniref:uncharacterized protein LOC131271126 n=1 Tax=Anopheles coustani TaxID=139045 RepID=UPI00265A3625
MAETKVLQAKQAKLQSSIVGMQRVQLFVDSYTADQSNQAEHRLQRFEAFFESYTQSFDDILELGVSPETIASLENIRTQVEELYCVTKGKLMDILSESMKITVKQEAATTSSLAAVKLPTISLPSFNGDYDTWLTFHDTFESLVHKSKELSAIQKFHYLRAALEGEAASQIQVLSITSENYDIAWTTLVERYSNKVLLRKKQVRSLLGLPKITKGSVQALRNIVDKFVLHLQVLQQLGEPIDPNSTIIVGLLADKLDDATVTAWEESLEPKQQPTYAQMVQFLRRRIQTMESIEVNRSTSSSNVERRKQGSRSHMNAAASAAVQQQQHQNEAVCSVCRQNHSVNQCTNFTTANHQQRLQIVRDKKLCANCLRENHTAAQCTSKFVCRQCSGRHHTLIHPGLFQPQQQPSNSSAPSSSMLAASTTHPSVQGTNFDRAILTTVLLVVVDANGGEHLARALLDSGSQPNAISEKLCQQLRLRRKVVDLEITGVDNTTTSAKHMVSAEIRSRIGEFNKTVDFIVLRKVTHDIPATPFGTTDWNIPADADLADPHFNTVGRIDMIIGVANFYTFLKEGRIRLHENGPLLVETVFGWVVTGSPPPPEQKMAMRCHFNSITPSLEDQIERFWKAEEIETTQTADERYCEEYFKDTVSRDTTGRYIVKLPKHQQHDKLIGASKATALRRFGALERKLSKNDELRHQYHDFMAEYIALHHMTPVEDDAADGPAACYLPHHPVFKDTSTTTKVRVVFDGSAATSTGHSLNDALMVGPVVQDDLLSLVIRFRKFKIAVVADLEKMYRQVLVHPVDRPLQRIIWRFDSSQPVQIYELDTITYGLAPSSFLATRTLLQLVEDEGTSYPLASNAIKHHLYMDDLIAGADSIEGAISLREELATLVSKGGFTFRKWCSNALPVLEGVPPALLGTKSAFNFDIEENIKTLGIRWDPEADVFRLDVSIVIKPSPHSKRSILSSIAQLYDPLGLISPVIVQAKLIMQLLWLLGLHWDDKVPDDLQRKWDIFCEQLAKLQDFTITRFAFIAGYHQAELHCFTDASEAAYGACIYIRSETSDGSVQMLLVHQHRKLLHGGISHTLSAVRDGFWPLNGRKAVRSAIRKCHECCRANPHPIQQPEGQLPVDRVTANDAFICTGIDYCGPIYLKPIHRKAAARKAYICIFVCLSTKAVHLELVSDLSTAAFLMALDRFVYRKGRPTHIYSDNGTNFIGAKNALHAIYAMLNHTKSKEQIDKHLADDAIQWHLIPPRAPNFGGLWEAAVKVAKTHLVRQLGAASLSEEEMATVLAKIEGCMNSRPLTPLSSDPNDLEALTPAHFLIKRPLQPLPEFNASCASQNQLAKYQRLQRFTQSFWDRWCNEYRKELNIAHRRQRKGYQLAEGDLIILKDDQLPPTRWP